MFGQAVESLKTALLHISAAFAPLGDAPAGVSGYDHALPAQNPPLTALTT